MAMSAKGRRQGRGLAWSLAYSAALFSKTSPDVSLSRLESDSLVDMRLKMVKKEEDVSKQIISFFTSSQQVQLYQGEQEKEEKSNELSI